MGHLLWDGESIWLLIHLYMHMVEKCDENGEGDLIAKYNDESINAVKVLELLKTSLKHSDNRSHFSISHMHPLMRDFWGKDNWHERIIMKKKIHCHYNILIRKRMQNCLQGKKQLSNTKYRFYCLKVPLPYSLTDVCPKSEEHAITFQPTKYSRYPQRVIYFEQIRQ